MRHSQCKWAKNKAYAVGRIRLAPDLPGYLCTCTIRYGQEEFLVAGWGYAPRTAVMDFWTEYRKIFLSIYGSVPRLIF